MTAQGPIYQLIKVAVDHAPCRISAKSYDGSWLVWDLTRSSAGLKLTSQAGQIRVGFDGPSLVRYLLKFNLESLDWQHLDQKGS